MKKFLLLFVLPLVAFAAMSAQLSSDCDAELAGIVSQIQSAETAYFNAHGVYFYLDETHATIPSDGVKSAPSNRSSWASAGITLPATMLQSLHIDEYEASAGNGYVVYQRVLNSGNNFRKATNQAGPETSRTHDWRQEDLK